MAENLQILWVYMEVYTGLHGGLRGSMQVYVEVYAGLCRAGEHYPIKICANDVIGCSGDINQSDFVGLCGSMWGWGTLSNQNMCQ